MPGVRETADQAASRDSIGWAGTNAAHVATSGRNVPVRGRMLRFATSVSRQCFDLALRFGEIVADRIPNNAPFNVEMIVHDLVPHSAHFIPGAVNFDSSASWPARPGHRQQHDVESDGPVSPGHDAMHKTGEHSGPLVSIHGNSGWLVRDSGDMVRIRFAASPTISGLRTTASRVRSSRSKSEKSPMSSRYQAIWLIAAAICSRSSATRSGCFTERAPRATPDRETAPARTRGQNRERDAEQFSRLMFQTGDCEQSRPHPAIDQQIEIAVLGISAGRTEPNTRGRATSYRLTSARSSSR